jgi:hypothetical protein
MSSATVDHEFARAFATALQARWANEEFECLILGEERDFGRAEFRDGLAALEIAIYTRYGPLATALDVLKVRNAVERLRRRYPDVYEEVSRGVLEDG